MASSRKETRPFSLSSLPDDIVVMILSALEAPQCLLCSEVAKSWRVDPARHLVWRGIARVWGLTLPPLSRRNTRASDDLKATLFTAHRKRLTAEQHMRDRFTWELRSLMKHKDSVPQLKKLITKWPAFLKDVNHQAVFMGHMSALHLAALWQRIKCFKHLCEHEGANVRVSDTGGFTPLLCAAWTGNLDLLEYLFSREDFDVSELEQTGIPPLTSSCGGKGPYNCYVWAYRKGHDSVAEAIFRKWKALLNHRDIGSEEQRAAANLALRRKLQAAVDAAEERCPRRGD